MGGVGKIGEWVRDNILQGFLQDYFADKLEFLGLSAGLAGLASVVAAIFSLRLVFTLFDPAPEVNWNELNPDNDNMMRKAFHDLHILVSLSTELNENAAATLDEFTDQVRRLGLYNSLPNWDRLHVYDVAGIRELYGEPYVVRSVAEKLRAHSASSFAEFCEQLHELGLYRQLSIWDRLDLSDMDAVQKLYKEPNVVQGVAGKLNANPACSVEEFYGQLKLLQQR